MTSPTPRYHIELQQGDDRPIRFPVTSTVDGNPVDVTGWPVRAQLRPSLKSADVMHVWSSAGGNAVAEQDAVLLLCDDSRDWTWSAGVFDVELTHPGGETTIEATGSLRLNKVVTR